MEDYNDELNKIILERLKERKYKTDRIKEIEMPRRSGFVRSMIGIAVAACVLGFVFISPWNNNGLIGDEAQRAATVNVDSLVDKGDYDSALRVIDTSIAKSDSTITALRNEIKIKKDEELDYLIQAEQLNIDNLKKIKQKIIKLKNKSK